MRNAAAVCLIVLLSACATSRPGAPESGITTKIITTTEVTQVEMRAGGSTTKTGQIAMPETLDAGSAIAIAPRAVALLATTDTLRLRVGEVLAFGSLPVMMKDSAGSSLGPLPAYDMRFDQGGIIDMSGGGVRGIQGGLVMLTLTIPQPFRAGQAGPAPSVVLPVRVVP